MVEDQIVPKEETNISWPILPPELPSRHPISKENNDYQPFPMHHGVPSPNTVAKDIDNNPGLSTTLDSGKYKSTLRHAK